MIASLKREPPIDSPWIGLAPDGSLLVSNAADRKASSADRPDLIGVRVSPVTILAAASYCSAVTKLRRPFLTGRYFLITVADEIACTSENSNRIFFSRKRRRPQNRRSALPAHRGWHYDGNKGLTTPKSCRGYPLPLIRHSGMDLCQ